MIRGAVYQVDFTAARGQELRGRRLGVLMSPTNSRLSVVTVVPVSIDALPAAQRPELEIAGQTRRVLCEQVRSIDARSVIGDPVGFLSRDEMAEVEFALSCYLGLVPYPDDYPTRSAG